MHILLGEDDGNIAAHVREKLEADGFAVTWESAGPDILERGRDGGFDAVLLDLGLPGLDGLSILRRWRREGIETPVLLLTARGSWMERVDGFDAGADDYLPKPFRIEELLARLRALLRRAGRGGNARPARLAVGRFSLDEAAMRISFDGAPLDLAPLEYRLLEQLIHSPGEVLTPYQLAESIQGRDDAAAKNAVEAIVARVRKKTAPDAIETRRGFGYLLPAATRSDPA